MAFIDMRICSIGTAINHVNCNKKLGRAMEEQEGGSRETIESRTRSQQYRSTPPVSIGSARVSTKFNSQQYVVISRSHLSDVEISQD